MNLDDEENLALELDAHTIALLRLNGIKADYIKWMKDAFNIMEKASKMLRKPKVYAIPGTFGVPTYTLRPPKQLVLPPAVQLVPNSPVWFSGGKTIAYGDKYQNRHQAWTRRDTEKLVREQERAKKATKIRIARKGK